MSSSESAVPGGRLALHVGSIFIDAAYVLGVCALTATAVLAAVRVPSLGTANGAVVVVASSAVALLALRWRLGRSASIATSLFTGLAVVMFSLVLFAVSKDAELGGALAIGGLVALATGLARSRTASSARGAVPVTLGADVPSWVAGVVFALSAVALFAALIPIAWLYAFAAVASFVGGAAGVLASERPRASALRVVAAVSTVAILTTTAGFASGALTRPKVFELPDGYRGWVLVQYEKPDCAMRVRDGIAELVIVNNQGCGCSSESVPHGVTLWSFYYVDESGRRTVLPSTAFGNGGLIWGEYSADRQPAAPFPQFGFFVGTEAQVQDQRTVVSRAVHTEQCLKGT